MQRSIKPEALKALLVHGDDVVLLDVRRKNDYDADASAVPGAVWRDPEKLAEWSATLPQDRNVVLYCMHGGSVSNAVVDTLRAKGFNACFIEGGIEAWKQAGGPVTAK